MKSAADGTAIPIPGILNILIATGSYAMAIALLCGASYFHDWWQIALCVVGFAFIGNTIFSLLHESVHRLFHPQKSTNDFFGQISAMFFPTGFFFPTSFSFGTSSS